MAKFKHGESGNPYGRPKGALSKRTLLLQLLETDALEIIEVLIKQAKAGDPNALKLCVERIVPKIQREPTGIQWPTKLDEETIPKLEADILQAALDGRITLDDAERLKKYIPRKPSDRATLRITTTDPNEAARIYQQFMRDT